jgi:hypothetical protein
MQTKIITLCSCAVDWSRKPMQSRCSVDSSWTPLRPLRRVHVQLLRIGDWAEMRPSRHSESSRFRPNWDRSASPFGQGAGVP